jgi:serine beta-lactamase-like protein LACTB
MRLDTATTGGANTHIRVPALSGSARRRHLRRITVALCLAAGVAVLPARPAAQAAAVPALPRARVADPSAGAPPPSRSDTGALGRIVEDHRLAIGAPAISAALVLDGRLAWADGFGEADLEQDVPARAETVYRIASISKPIAATALMQLVERGQVALDDTIQRYVPTFPRKPEGEIRLRHLLTHTSGIRHYTGNEFLSATRYNTVLAALSIFKDDPLLFVPGARYEYTTYGYNLVAAVVERVSGLRFEQYLAEHVFGPAGMTTARLERAEDLVRGRARQYTADRRPDAPFPLRNAPYVDLSNKWSGGGIIATVLDLARFDIALNDGRLLRADTLRQMYASARLTSGRATGYGLGWMLVTDARGRTWVGHSGGAAGGTTYLLRHPATRTAVALLCNLENAPGLRDLALRLADAAAPATATP